MPYLQNCRNLLKGASFSRISNMKSILRASTNRFKSESYSSRTVPQLDFVSKNHQELYELSLRKPDSFWGQLGASKLKWMTNFHTVRSIDMTAGKHEWFLGGQLNVSGSPQLLLLGCI